MVLRVPTKQFSVSVNISIYSKQNPYMCLCVCVCVYMYSNIECIQNGWRTLIAERWLALDLCIDYASCSPVRSLCFEANQDNTLRAVAIL